MSRQGILVAEKAQLFSSDNFPQTYANEGNQIIFCIIIFQ